MHKPGLVVAEQVNLRVKLRQERKPVVEVALRIARLVRGARGASA
jgi:hypothetical protein